MSVGFVGGKRCLGGMYELLMHCHYVVAVDEARFGWPEVALPVVPGMEGCHWPFRRAQAEHWGHLLHALLSGEPVRARDGIGWLIDAAEPMDNALHTAWAIASGARHGITRRGLETRALSGVPSSVSGLAPADDPLTETARAAIVQCVKQSCGTTAAEALTLQARLAAEFLASQACRQGRVGAERARVTST